jgi:hypothetical protein
LPPSGSSTVCVYRQQYTERHKKQYIEQHKNLTISIKTQWNAVREYKEQTVKTYKVQCKLAILIRTLILSVPFQSSSGFSSKRGNTASWFSGKFASFCHRVERRDLEISGPLNGNS